MNTVYTFVDADGSVAYYPRLALAKREAFIVAENTGEDVEITECKFRLSLETFCNAACRGGWADSERVVFTVKAPVEEETNV